MKVYVIDVYKKYMRQGNEISVHWVRGRPYCIREVEMDWGIPQVDNNKMEEQIPPQAFSVFENYNAAVAYIKDMQKLNGGIQ